MRKNHNKPYSFIYDTVFVTIKNLMEKSLMSSGNGWSSTLKRSVDE